MRGADSPRGSLRAAGAERGLSPAVGREYPRDSPAELGSARSRCDVDAPDP